MMKKDSVPVLKRLRLVDRDGVRANMSIPVM